MHWRTLGLTLPAVVLGSWTALTAVAAQSPSVEFALGSFQPKHGDVEIDVVDPKSYSQCKVAQENGPVVDIQGKKKQTSAWVVYGPQGQVLRKYWDMIGDDKVDQWSYYKNGLEVYRDSDTNGNEKIDQSRWLNTGGSRWGIDTNEDGKIDTWRIISAEEVSRVAVKALVTQDAALITPLLITKDDLKLLGITGPTEEKILTAVSDPATKLRKIASASKMIGPKTAWMRFDGSAPSVIPAEQLKTPKDIVVYENVMAIVEAGPNPGLVQIGELVRIGDVWKMTSLPQPLEGKEIQITESGFLMQPQFASTGDLAPAGNISPEMQNLLNKLQALGQNAPPPAAQRAAKQKFHTDRAEIIEQIRKLAKTDEERAQWTQQLADGIAAAVQMNEFPAGVAELKKLEDETARTAPKSALVSYLQFRRMSADFSQQMNVAMQSNSQEEQKKIQDRWLADLEKFVADHPNAADTPDAMLQLAVAEEFKGDVAKAREWYQKLVKASATTPPGVRAAGAIKRLDLIGNRLTLAGPGLNVPTVSLNDQQFRGKKVLVLFWATWCKPCEEDLPQLIALYDQNKAKGFEVLGVNLDAGKAGVAPFLAQHKVPNWPQIHEPGGLDSKPAQEFGIISLPTMFLVDEKGVVTGRASNVADVKTFLVGTPPENAVKEAVRKEAPPGAAKK